jgi:hypothetical protein
MSRPMETVKRRKTPNWEEAEEVTIFLDGMVFLIVW